MTQLKYSFFSIIMLIVLLASCKPGNTIIVDDGFNRKEINYSGEISFNDDETAVESITPGGYLEFHSNGRKLIAENNYHGGVRYKMYRNGKRLYEDETEGQQFLAEAIDQMLSMGFNTRKRIEKLYQKGGNPALLRAAVKANGNYLKQSYVDYILAHGNPDDDDLVDIAKIVTFKMDGTFEKAQVLKKYTPGAFSNPEVSAAWFEAIETIDSDFERANLLKAVSAEQLKYPVAATAWMDAVKDIQADFEKANTLKAILNQPLTKDQYRQSIIVSNTITSDFEQCNFLKEIIEKENIPQDVESFAVLMQSLHNVESGFEKSDILKKLLDKGLYTEEQWSLLLKEVALINGDFEKANILTAAAAKMPRTTGLTETYAESAKTISSESEYGRVLKAIE